MYLQCLQQLVIFTSRLLRWRAAHAALFSLGIPGGDLLRGSSAELLLGEPKEKVLGEHLFQWDLWSCVWMQPALRKGMGKGGGGLAALHLLFVSFLDLSVASCPGTMWQAGSARVQLLEELLNPEQRDSATYCYRLVPGRVSAVRINSAWLTELLLLLDLEVKGKRKVF